MFRFGRLTALSSHGTNDVDTGLSFILYSLNDVGVVRVLYHFAKKGKRVIQWKSDIEAHRNRSSKTEVWKD